jgi:hypothetical protein
MRVPRDVPLVPALHDGQIRGRSGVGVLALVRSQPAAPVLRAHQGGSARQGHQREADRDGDGLGSLCPPHARRVSPDACASRGGVGCRVRRGMTGTGTRCACSPDTGSTGTPPDVRGERTRRKAGAQSSGTDVSVTVAGSASGETNNVGVRALARASGARDMTTGASGMAIGRGPAADTEGDACAKPRPVHDPPGRLAGRGDAMRVGVAEKKAQHEGHADDDENRTHYQRLGWTAQ